LLLAARVAQRLFVRALRETQRESTDANAAGIECLHEVDEALPLRTQASLRRYEGVLQEELTRVGRAPAHLVLLLRRADARRERLELRRVTDAHAIGRLAIGRLLRHDEAGNALRATLAVRHGRDDEDLAHTGMRDEDLAAVQPVTAVLAH